MIDQETEKILWRDAIIVFDNCALGNIYSLASDAQQTFIDILSLIKDRVWIPKQVQNEYDRHHEKFLHDTYKDQYALFEKMMIQGEEYDKALKDIVDLIADDTFHPYFSKDACDQVKESYDKISEARKNVDSIVRHQKDARREEIKKMAEEDKLNTLLLSLEHGEGFRINELAAIVNEGIARYEGKIPPGYMDARDKEGIDKYGDLIIWKEILRHAKRNKKPIILISDDVKEDWNISKKDETRGPRTELIAEFYEEVGLPFWKYSLKYFIDKLVEYYPSDKDTLPLFSKLEGVKNQLMLMTSLKAVRVKNDNKMLLKCQSCGCEFEVAESELYLDWEPDGSCERSMGEEREYVAEDGVSCPHCNRDITITMRVWEYPLGVYNTQSTEAKGAEVLKEMDLYEAFDFNDENYGTCEECGEYKYIDSEKNGICSDCYDRKWNEATKND